MISGDKEAQTRFYEENAKRLFPICAHFLGFQDEEAEDLVQESFLIAFRKLGEFEFRSSLYTWLAHICVFLCYERLRKRKRELGTLHEDLERLSLPQTETRMREEGMEKEKNERLETLDRLMGSMSEKCRQVLELRDRQGMSYMDLSRTLRLPPGTVMSQLARCRKALKSLLQSERKEART
jgi:RNA polymerase sigma-70 factor (ECF subfamily)